MKPRVRLFKVNIGDIEYTKMKTIAIVQGSGTIVNTMLFMTKHCPIDQRHMLNEFYKNACWFWAKYKSFDDLNPVHKLFINTY